MKILKVIPTNSIPVSRIQELDKALREKFSPIFSRPKVLVYCMIVNNKSSQFMVNEFDVCCEEGMFKELPFLTMGYIMGHTHVGEWENPITQDMMKNVS